MDRPKLRDHACGDQIGPHRNERLFDRLAP